MRLLVTRPRPEAEALARELEARGHATLIQPLLVIERAAAPPPALDGVQAILITSANAAPALAAMTDPPPVIAVGEASAAAVRAAGVPRVEVAGGDARGLARHLIRHRRPEEGALLHLCGADVRPGLAEPLAAAGFDLRHHVVYRAQAVGELSPATVMALRQRQIDAVLLFSPRTAAIFSALVRHHQLASGLTATEALCLSDAVAAATRDLPWQAVRIARRPEMAALLRLLDGAG
jgi:uroporphyrinogen-III synthase